jgi:hypothetical protein
MVCLVLRNNNRYNGSFNLRNKNRYNSTFDFAQQKPLQQSVSDNKFRAVWFCAAKIVTSPVYNDHS